MYSEMVQYIKTHTLKEITNHCELLGEKRTGSTRTAYIFSEFVVKIEIFRHNKFNEKEYQAYCRYVTRSSQVPVCRTRLYKSSDNAMVLLQERLSDILSDYSHEAGKSCCYDKDNLAQLGIRRSWGYADGYQMGKNKQGRYTFFDYPYVS